MMIYIKKIIWTGLFCYFSWASSAIADPSTPADRAALFDYILTKTMERTAFSPTKPLDIGVAYGAGPDVTMAQFVRGEMLEYRDEMIAADTDEKLYYVLRKISNTRWDSHIYGVRLVKGGIAPAASWTKRGSRQSRRHAPIKFKPDYSDRDAMSLFVSDYAKDVKKYGRVPAIGDRLVAVNGEAAGSFIERFRRYFGYSSHRMLWWHMAQGISRHDPRRVAPSLYKGDQVTYELQPKKGPRYSVTLPYIKGYQNINWAGYDDHYEGGYLSRRIENDPDFVTKTMQVDIARGRYKGFEHVSSHPAFDIYISRLKKIILLQGHSFYYKTIPADLKALMAYARAHDILDYGVIYDLTRGGGGDLEEYTLTRLQSKPFKIMFGNLRISDITPALAVQLRKRALKKINRVGKRTDRVLAHDVDKSDTGEYLVNWLDNDLARAIREKQAYSNNVQFKNQFLDTTSDGFLYPANEHFTGPFVLFTSPYACSGADQFSSMVIENNLGLSVGMRQGGCTNTWEWNEVLKFPISAKPVVKFAWTAGHSLGPAGHVSEGRSAEPTIIVPLTRDNHLRYYDILMGHALDYIEKVRKTGKQAPTLFERFTGYHVRRGN